MVAVLPSGFGVWGEGVLPDPPPTDPLVGVQQAVHAPIGHEILVGGLVLAPTDHVTPAEGQAGDQGVVFAPGVPIDHVTAKAVQGAVVSPPPTDQEHQGGFQVGGRGVASALPPNDRRTSDSEDALPRHVTCGCSRSPLGNPQHCCPQILRGIGGCSRMTPQC